MFSIPPLYQTDRAEVKQWFWRASFAERYRGASENYISKDIDRVYEFVITGNASQSARIFGEAPSAAVLRNVEFRSNNSRTRAFILALAKAKPRNITNGATIDPTDALSSFNKKQFHHIYPRAYLKRIDSPEEHNSVVNICMLAASENNKISDDNPNTYIPNCAAQLTNDGWDADTVFLSNHFPNPSTIDYSTLSYGEFLQLRADILHQTISKLCEGNV